jgi:mannose-1-phosphate guanylyltransferase
MAPLAGAPRTLILTSGSLLSSIRRLAPEIPRQNIVVEPRPAGTAAALSWAASIIRSRAGVDAVMISVHADWAVENEDAYCATLRNAAEAAILHSALITVGVVPTRPDPGLGYIRPGEGLSGGVFRVAQFVEKPDRERAIQMIREGCLWNSGIFVWRVGDFLSEVERLTPEVAPSLQAAHGNPARFFQTVKNVSVDVGVLERSSRVLVLPGDFGWDDVGTWAALRRVRRLDASGNAPAGRVYSVESTGNVVHAEDTQVVLYGVSDLVVVTEGELTLVTTVDRAADLKQLIEALPEAMRTGV